MSPECIDRLHIKRCTPKSERKDKVSVVNSITELHHKFWVQFPVLLLTNFRQIV